MVTFAVFMEDMTERRATLLEKVYFEGCPGCKQDRKKAASSGIPYREFFYVWIVTLCAGTHGFAHDAVVSCSRCCLWVRKMISCSR